MKKKALLGFKLLLGRTSSSSQKQRRQQHPVHEVLQCSALLIQCNCCPKTKDGAAATLDSRQSLSF